MGGFSGKVAVVTGGGSGIGQATAIRFAQAGARVLVGDIAAEAGEETVSLIRQAGGEAACRKTDVTDSNAVNALIAQALSQFGRLDYAANIAGMPQSGGLFCPDALWHQVIAVNLTGIFFSARAEAAAMKRLGGGVIINCASIAGLRGTSTSPFYNAAKAGVIGFTKSIALELAPSGIRVNAVCPGITVSPMTDRFFGGDVEALAAGVTPLGRASQPDEQAAAMLWLCSDDAGFVTGTTLVIDGGITAGPPPVRG
jgi:NAD(P)-dependent dehydrogenase (short-subunit alcohol dehydrogenase family)